MGAYHLAWLKLHLHCWTTWVTCISFLIFLYNKRQCLCLLTLFVNEWVAKGNYVSLIHSLNLRREGILGTFDFKLPDSDKSNPPPAPPDSQIHWDRNVGMKVLSSVRCKQALCRGEVLQSPATNPLMNIEGTWSEMVQGLHTCWPLTLASQDAHLDKGLLTILGFFCLEYSISIKDLEEEICVCWIHKDNNSTEIWHEPRVFKYPDNTSNFLCLSMMLRPQLTLTCTLCCPFRTGEAAIHIALKERKRCTSLYKPFINTMKKDGYR